MLLLLLLVLLQLLWAYVCPVLDVIVVAVFFGRQLKAFYSDSRDAYLNIPHKSKVNVLSLRLQLSKAGGGEGAHLMSLLTGDSVRRGSRRRTPQRRAREDRIDRKDRQIVSRFLSLLCFLYILLFLFLILQFLYCFSCCLRTRRKLAAY